MFQLEKSEFTILPSVNIIRSEKYIENLKELIDPTIPPGHGILSILPEERHVFLKILNILLYKYDLSLYLFQLQNIMEHVLNILDGHIHICSKSKFNKKNTEENVIELSNQLENMFHHHYFNEIQNCPSCSIFIYKLDIETLNLAMLTITEFHLHHFELGSNYLEKTMNILYKFVYYDFMNGRYKAIEQKIDHNSDLFYPPIPTSLTSVANRCFYQLITKLECMNFVVELFKMEMIEPYPFFYTLVFTIIVNDSHESLLEFINSTCLKFIHDKSHLSSNLQFLKNLTYLIHCTKHIVLSKDTYCINYNVMKFREFVPDIDLNVVYGSKSKISKNDKINKTLDNMSKICSSFDLLLKLIQNSKINKKEFLHVTVNLIRELIIFFGATCFLFKNMVPLIFELFNSLDVSVLDKVKVAVEWYCILVDSNDKLMLFESLVDSSLNEIKKLMTVYSSQDLKIQHNIILLCKVAQTKPINSEFVNDEISTQIEKTLETIPLVVFIPLLQKKLQTINKIVKEIYTNPLTGRSNKDSRNVPFYHRLLLIRIPITQVNKTLIINI